MSWTKEKVAAVLKEISARAPKYLLQSIIEKRDMTPTMKMVADEALKSDISEEKKDAIQTLKDGGYFNKQKSVENQKVARMLDNYYGREINKAIREGRLPPRSKLQELNPKMYGNK